MLSHRSHTDQKISYTKLHMKALMQVLQKNEALDKRLTIGAYQQAIKFHLMLICDAFRQEIASDNNLIVQKQQSFSELAQLLTQKEIHCQYCNMLADLEKDSNSWLYSLQNSYSSCFEISTVTGTDKLFSQRNKSHESGAVSGLQSIKLKNVTDLSQEQQFQHDLEHLLDTIKQYRSLVQEW